MLTRLVLLAVLAGMASAPAPVSAEDAPMPRRTPKRDPAPKEPAPKDAPKPKADDRPASTAPGTAKKKDAKPGQPAPYDTVITADAKTQPGVFAVHRIDDRVYFEVPADKFGKLFLLRSEVAKGSNGTAFNGQELGKRFVKLDRRDNKVFVIEADFDKRSGADTAAAVEASGVEPVIGVFPVAAEGKDRSVVVAATGVFLGDSLDLGAKRAGGVGAAIDPERSFLTDTKAFPTNIEVRAQLTFRAGPGGGAGNPFAAGGSPATKTAVVHTSIFQLPDTPMAGRYVDPRVGYFTENFTDYSAKRTWSETKEYIARFKLEKKDPTKDLSEPVKPITFYLAPEIPEKYRGAMKKGVEDWQPAFEKAGFKNAIVCLDPPSKAIDPNWDAEDARYSVIRWVAEPVANAFGPHVADPRSGETLSAHIVFYHDILKIVHMWYFVQCSAQDDRARKFPFPDDLQAELIRYVACHEVGHTLGLRHNHRASQAYSVEQLRDPKFVADHGNVASIMSYGRYNYVAQPEDKIPVKDLIPKLAPYDFFAIEWGYKPLPDAKTPDAEKPALNEIAARQLKDPFVRFGGEDGPAQIDPTVLTENIGNDPVKATALGFKNLDRVYDYLLASTTAQDEDFDTLREAYQALLTHRRLWTGAVVKQVGGVVESRTLGGRGEQFARVPKDKQKAAVAFLVANTFTTPKKVLDPAVVNNLKYAGVASDIIGLQRATLVGLLSPARLNRLVDAEVIDPDHAYPIAELVADVQAGVWSDLAADAPKIDPIRRSLQRAYVDTLKAEFDPPAPAGGLVLTTGPRRAPALEPADGGRNTELRAVARVSLRDVRKQIAAALPKVTDSATKAHLTDLAEEIDDVFDRKKK